MNGEAADNSRMYLYMHLAFKELRPFVKTLDNALQSFGVRQQYFGGGGAFIGNHVHKALKVKCTCAMHVYVNNSYNLNIYRYLTSSLCAYLYQRWHKRNCPTDLERLPVKCQSSSPHSPYTENVTIYVIRTSLMRHKHMH